MSIVCQCFSATCMLKFGLVLNYLVTRLAWVKFIQVLGHVTLFLLCYSLITYVLLHICNVRSIPSLMTLVFWCDIGSPLITLHSCAIVYGDIRISAKTFVSEIVNSVYIFILLFFSYSCTLQWSCSGLLVHLHLEHDYVYLEVGDWIWDFCWLFFFLPH